MLADRRVIEPNERDFTKVVIAYAELCGWWCYHVTNVHGRLRGQTSVGFPDLVLVKHKVLYRELKVGKNKLSMRQKQWGDHLQAAGEDWAVWRPHDSWDVELRDTINGPQFTITYEDVDSPNGPEWGCTIKQETSEGTRNSLQQHFRSGTGGMPEEA